MLFLRFPILFLTMESCSSPYLQTPTKNRLPSRYPCQAKRQLQERKATNTSHSHRVRHCRHHHHQNPQRKKSFPIRRTRGKTLAFRLSTMPASCHKSTNLRLSTLPISPPRGIHSDLTLPAHLPPKSMTKPFLASSRSSNGTASPSSTDPSPLDLPSLSPLSSWGFVSDAFRLMSVLSGEVCALSCVESE